jgi:beta-lactamase regulating signal transducer with metallopeptidase domain
MPMLTQFQLASTVDILIRVSIVLGAGLLLSLAARRDAALRHAILAAHLAAALLVPAMMPTMRALPVPRLELGVLARTDRDERDAKASVSSRTPNEPHHGLASPDHPDPAIDAVRAGEARPGPETNASPRFEQRALGLGATRWLATDGVRFSAGALLAAWLLGAIVKLAGLGLSLLRLRGIVARARPAAGDQIQSMLGLVQRRVGMRHPPRLWETAEVSAPVATGVIGDHILLPEGWARRLTAGELLAVLCHEAAHLARRDHRVVILQEVLASVLWFHPLAHLFNRALSRVREEVCDNYAIIVAERPAYCEALLRLAAGLPHATPRGAATMWTRHWRLEDRIRGILDERRPTRTGISGAARSATAGFAMAICGLIALPQLGGSRAHDRDEAKDRHESPRYAVLGPVENVMTKRLIRAFPVNGEQTLRIQNLAGRVELVPGDGPTVEIEATVRVGDLAEAELNRLIDSIRWVEAPSEDADPRWGLAFPTEDYPTVRYPVSGETKTDSDTVRYLGREVRISNRRGDSTPSVEFDLRVSLPPGVRVAVDNAVGPIDGESVDSPLKLSTRHGVIKLGHVRAPVDATSKHGDVLISQLDADAVVHTGRGGIVLSRVTRGHVTLSTGSGHCRVVLLPATGFRLQYSGARPLEVIGGGVSRASARSGGRSSEGLSRGTGGPSITVASDTGDTVIVVAQDGM